MPLFKQEKFREYYSKSIKVRNDAVQCHAKYFDEIDSYNANYDVFSDFFYEVDFVYRDAKAVKNGLESILEFSEQKGQISIDKCKEHIQEMEEVIYQCIQDFREVYGSFEGNFTDVERESFQNYSIYNEINRIY